jgi:PPE-repeat protein
LQANKRKADAEDAISGHVEEEKFGIGTFVMGIIAILFGSVPTTLGVLMAYPSISMTDNILNSSGLDIAGTTFGGLFVASIGLGIILIGLVCIWEYINQK